MAAYFHSPLVISIAKGALAGAASAAWIDFHAFRAWQSWHDAVAYDWRTATFRWASGAIVGALSGAGIAVA